MEITRRDRDDLVILDIEGEITLYQAARLKNYLNDLAAADRANVIINFEKVEYVDSSGLGALIAGMTTLKKNHGLLKFYKVPKSVRMLLKLTRLENLFEVFDTEDAARASFK